MADPSTNFAPLPSIDQDKLAMLLTNPDRAAQLAQFAQMQPQVQAPPGTQMAALQPPPNPAAAPPPAAPKPYEAGLTAPDPASVGVGAPVAPDLAKMGPTPVQQMISARPGMDMDPATRLQQDEAARAKVMADPDNRARWWQRLAAAGTAGAIAYGTHNTQAALDAARGINDYRYERALRPVNANIEADQAGVHQAQQNFENMSKTWEQGLHAASAQGLASEREAKAQKYENAIDPRSLRQKDDGSWIGTTYGGKEVPAGDPGAGKNTKPTLSETIATRKQEGATAGLKGEDLKYYTLNGKLREPNPDLEARLADSRARQGEAALNHQDHEADVAATRDATATSRYQTQVSQYNNKKNDISQKEQGEYDKQEADFSKKFTKAKNKDEQDALTREHEAKKAQIAGRYTQMYGQLGAEPEAPSSPAPRSKAAPAPPAAPAQNAPPASAPAASSAKGKDFGPAPAGAKEGRTGKLPDGTPIVAKGGRLVGY